MKVAPPPQDEDGFRDEYDDADGDWGGPKELIRPEVQCRYTLLLARHCLSRQLNACTLTCTASSLTDYIHVIINCTINANFINNLYGTFDYSC